MKKSSFISIFAGILVLTSCSNTRDMTLEEIKEYVRASESEFLRNSVSKPWNNNSYVPGKVCGVWNDFISDDPKTFNQLIAERDGESAGIIDNTLDCLVDYDMETKKWFPRLASFEIETDEEKDILKVIYTIRDDVFWSFYKSDKKIPVTSDDFVFWYNDIQGEKAFGSSGYNSQWVKASDGGLKHVDCVKITDKKFEFVFPRIVADPLLATNMVPCPSFVYSEAKRKDGVEGVKKLFATNCNLSEIPSCGKWFICEYVSGQRVVLQRNEDFWEKDSEGTSIPYMEQKNLIVASDNNLRHLLFNEGKLEYYIPQPENVSDVIKNQKEDYTVFNSEGSMSASLWSFNQNPKNKDEKFYKWFCKKEFRQAMSCLLNRDRIIDQTYRGLAQPKYSFFPEVNPYFNADIQLKYKYNPQKALELLKSAGFVHNERGLLTDDQGNLVEYDISIPSSNTVYNDIAVIIRDECSKIGITVNIRQIDFQKLVEMMTSTFDWQSIMIGLGSNAFPSQGSNVWPSNGNLHLWYPLQEKPATEWEERIDYLYNEGSYTIDKDKAKEIWDEYQTLILEQCPVIYLLRSCSFFAIRNRWDLSNVYYDNKSGVKLDYVFLKE